MIRPFTSSAIRKYHVTSSVAVILTGKDLRNTVRNNDVEELAALLDKQGSNSEIVDDTDNMGRSAVWIAAFKGTEYHMF